MSDWLMAHEPHIRLGAFASVFLLMAIWELLAERRTLIRPKGRRWFANLSLVALNTVILRLVFPTAAVGVAAVVSEEGWGFLNWLELPQIAGVLLSIVLFDLAIYLQHVMFHAVPALWRLHMVHHADADFDVTTGTRFHPLEMLASMAIKLALVALIGPPVVAVLLFEILLNATAMFNHGNVQLPAALDRLLRLIVVTPDMHRVHHSSEPSETNKNFGFNLPIWDRLFGTYRERPAHGQTEMQLGLDHVPAANTEGLLSMLRLPFTAEAGAYPENLRKQS